MSVLKVDMCREYRLCMYFFSVPSVSEKMAELAKLQSELEMQRSAVSQITELKAQLDAQKQKNNVRKTWQWV